MHEENEHAQRAQALGVIAADRRERMLDEQMAGHDEADGERAQEVEIGGVVAHPLLLALIADRSWRPVSGVSCEKSARKIGFHLLCQVFLFE